MDNFDVSVAFGNKNGDSLGFGCSFDRYGNYSRYATAAARQFGSSNSIQAQLAMGICNTQRAQFAVYKQFGDTVAANSTCTLRVETTVHITVSFTGSVSVGAGLSASPSCCKAFI